MAGFAISRWPGLGAINNVEAVYIFVRHDEDYISLVFTGSDVRCGKTGKTNSLIKTNRERNRDARTSEEALDKISRSH